MKIIIMDRESCPRLHMIILGQRGGHLGLVDLLARRVKLPPLHHRARSLHAPLERRCHSPRRSGVSTRATRTRAAQAVPASELSSDNFAIKSGTSPPRS